jgi:hypothetical protein
MADIDETQNNAENIGDSSDSERDPETGRFLPGNHAGGGKKGSRWLSKLLEEALIAVAKNQGEAYHTLLIKRVMKQAIEKGDMRAIEHIWDRIEGGVPKTLEVTNPDGNLKSIIIVKHGSDDKPAA